MVVHNPGSKLGKMIQNMHFEKVSHVWNPGIRLADALIRPRKMIKPVEKHQGCRMCSTVLEQFTVHSASCDHSQVM